MHVNNETGVIQPVAELASLVERDGLACALHVDAAQGFGKELAPLRHPAPRFHQHQRTQDRRAQGRRRPHRPAAQRDDRPALAPLTFGGGQERGLRPGTLPVPLVAGLGLAAELAAAECDSRHARCRAFREQMLAGLAPLAARRQRRSGADAAEHPEPDDPRHRIGRGDRGVGGSRRHLERRRLHVAVVYVQPRPLGDGHRLAPRGRRAAAVVVARLGAAGSRGDGATRSERASRRAGRHERSRAETVFYRRSRFATRLPVDRLYTPAHYWLVEEEPGVWRVGLTGFATRMLGDLVEYGFSVKPGGAIDVGQTIGWLEGFKAVADLYSVARGEFLGANEALAGDITLVESEPYKRGWLYRVRGEPARSAAGRARLRGSARHDDRRDAARSSQGQRRRRRARTRRRGDA